MTGQGVTVAVGLARQRGFWLLARRSISDPTDLAFYVCFAPAATSLATLVRGGRLPLAGRGGLRAGQG